MLQLQRLHRLHLSEGYTLGDKDSGWTGVVEEPCN